MIIGITGTIASGKGIASKYIHDKGFVHHSLSTEIRAIAKERKIPVSRLTLSKLGGDLKKELPGGSILANKITEKIEHELKEKQDFVIDGIRDVEEITELRSFCNKKRIPFILIGIDADQKVRFERLKKRRRHGDPETFSEFKDIDDKEKATGGGQEVGPCLERADFLLDNSGPVDELYEKLDQIVSQ